MIDRLGELVNASAPAAIESASWLGHAVVLLVLLLGVGLWLFGGRAMRPALGLLGLAAGAGLGFAIGEALGPALDTWIAVGVGAVAGLLMGVIMFRLTMALTLGAVLGVLAPLATATLIHHFGSPLEGTRLGDSAEQAAAEKGDQLRNLFLEGVPVVDGLEDARRLAEQGRETLGDERFDEALGEALGEHTGADDATVEAVRRAGRFMDELAREVQPVWEKMPVRDRLLLILSMVTGWAMGLAIGMVLPRSAAALIAAGAGAGLWLVAAVWLGTAAGVLGAEGGWVSIPSKPLAWIGVWGLVWMVGAVFQFTVLGRKRTPKSEAPASGS